MKLLRLTMVINITQLIKIRNIPKSIKTTNWKDSGRSRVQSRQFQAPPVKLHEL